MSRVTVRRGHRVAMMMVHHLLSWQSYHVTMI
jgi:hypothetical protein